ncbi:LysR family transcriptional regulator [Brevibacterium zhoupengii]|uniref:LysR family transcriptional regulator n=1 Tax=Brevibacterium zhoupengii TaxID=2898795 RepID=UPI001E400B33|nr:LysR family transcriptional regulator [Brevibacterium zhoupengii]
MSEITLRQLEYFVAVVDAESVTVASRKVNVSQATVSMSIAQLEKSLGTALLIRQRAKGVAPTRSGREFAIRARRVLALTAELEDVAKAEMSGPIEVGCVSSLSPQVIPPLAAHFSSEFPEVDFNYREGSADELQTALAEGIVDIAIVFSRQCVNTVTAEELANVTLKVMLPSNHALHNRPDISFADIASEPAIFIDLPPSRDRSIEFMRSAGVEPRIRWTSTNLATVEALVANGLGYSLRYALPGETRSPDNGVIEVPVSDPIPKNGISAALPTGVRASHRSEEVIRYLRQHFEH